MKDFAHMASGEWRMGVIQADTWHWGPGERSMRVLTVGMDGGGNPWRELVIYYWRPDRKQVCVLGFHPDIPGLGRGVASGTIKFDGRVVESRLSLYQPRHPGRNRREMAGRWTFDGPDAYHEELLEDDGSGFSLLAEWDYVRAPEHGGLPLPDAGEPPLPSKNLKPFEAMLGSWRGLLERPGAGAIEVESTFAWVEYLDVVYVRTVTRTGTDDPAHVLDAYLYHHVGTGRLHCLALSGTGAVYEGLVAVDEGGGLEIELSGVEGDRNSQEVVHVEIEPSGKLRQRVWSIAEGGRTLLFDLAQTKLDSLRN